MKPDTTFILARILGPLLAVAGVMLISQHARMRAMMGDFLGDDALMAFAGFTMLALGLTLLALHQRWDSISAGIISVIGWLTLARGGVLLLAPGLVRDAAYYVLTQANITINDRVINIMPIAGCVIALIGVWLSYAGYIAGTLRAESSRR